MLASRPLQIPESVHARHAAGQPGHALPVTSPPLNPKPYPRSRSPCPPTCLSSSSQCTPATSQPPHTRTIEPTSSSTPLQPLTVPCRYKVETLGHIRCRPRSRRFVALPCLTLPADTTSRPRSTTAPSRPQLYRSSAPAARAVSDFSKNNCAGFRCRRR